MDILKSDFYERNTLQVAKDLLGKILIHKKDDKMLAAKIIETEAYVGICDKAAHVYGGRRTLRVMPLYGPGGTIYIFAIYGMYVCFNAITEKEGNPQGVLVRAVEPLIGLEDMAFNRFNKSYSELTKKQIINLTSGPSKLCIAMDISKESNGKMLWGGELFIVKPDSSLKEKYEKQEEKCSSIVETTRIGVDYAEEAKDYPYRFYYKDNMYVSKK